MASSMAKRYKNQCMNGLCNHHWIDFRGSFAEHYDGCPGCGSLYWWPIAEVGPNGEEVEEMPFGPIPYYAPK